MTDQKTFKARYEVDDGYVGGRPQYFTIHARDIDDDMTDDDLQSLYEELCDEHMRQKIVCATSRADEFVEWAKAQIAARAQGEK